MKRLLFFKLWALAVFLLAINTQARCESPWKWQTTLQLNNQQGGVMHLPVSLFVDEELERYYVIDGGNNRLLSFDLSGEFLGSFSANNSLLKPFAMVREPGFLWVVEKGRNSITIIDLEKKTVTPKTVTDQGRLLYPERIVKNKDILYVLDKASGRIFLLDQNLSVRDSLGCEQCRGGFVDFKYTNGMIWALAQQDYEVQQFTRDGKFVTKIKLEEEKTGFPRSLAVDDSENVYILDRHAAIVRVYDRTGSYKYEFLEPGHSRGQLYYPVEIRFDPWGRLCVVDEGNGRVQIYSKR